MSTFFECRQNGGLCGLTLSSPVPSLPPHVASSVLLQSVSSPPRPDERGPALGVRRDVYLSTSFQRWSYPPVNSNPDTDAMFVELRSTRFNINIHRYIQSG